MIPKNHRVEMMKHLATAQLNICQAITYLLKNSGYYEEFADKQHKNNVKNKKLKKLRKGID